MEELAGEGATVIIAGFDRESADRASIWAERSGIAVLLLAAPSAARMPRAAGFVLGERVERQLAMLGEALVRHGVKTAAFVTDSNELEAATHAVEGGGVVVLPPTRCDVPLSEAGKPRFPVASWLASGAQGWLVSGPTACARDVLRDVKRLLEVKRVPGEHAIAVTLEGGLPPAEVPKGIVVLSAAAGLVPILATRAEETNEPDVRMFIERFGVRPSYWTALGRDAGAIARAALAPLPSDTTSDAKAVAQRRAIVQSGLSGTQLSLWTTDEKGIGADRVLGRALRLSTWRAQ
jgi:hypothetical protein